MGPTKSRTILGAIVGAMAFTSPVTGQSRSQIFVNSPEEMRQHLPIDNYSRRIPWAGTLLNVIGRRAEEREYKTLEIARMIDNPGYTSLTVELDNIVLSLRISHHFDGPPSRYHGERELDLSRWLPVAVLDMHIESKRSAKDANLERGGFIFENVAKGHHLLLERLRNPASATSKEYLDQLNAFARDILSDVVDVMTTNKAAGAPSPQDDSRVGRYGTIYLRPLPGAERPLPPDSPGAAGNVVRRHPSR